MNKRKNKYTINNVIEILFLPFCGLMILYCIFKPLIYTFEYIRVVQFFLLTGAILLVMSGILSKVKKKDKEEKLYSKNKTWEILSWIFIAYFVVYLLLQLDTVSVYFNYLMVLLYGIVTGYKFKR